MRIAKKQIIRNDDGVPYMVRRAINTRFGGVKLHHILRSDDDRDLHDHPWSFLSIILWGGYFEHRPTQWCENCGRSMIGLNRFCNAGGAHHHALTEKTWHGPGSVLWRPAPSVHRLELPAGKTVWSLVFTGPKRREWGFHTICGFIPWMKYNAAKESGC
jgi:hypothetical protein